MDKTEQLIINLHDATIGLANAIFHLQAGVRDLANSLSIELNNIKTTVLETNAYVQEIVQELKESKKSGN